MKSTLTLELTDDQVQTIINALTSNSSVNVVPNIDAPVSSTDNTAVAPADNSVAAAVVAAGANSN